MKKVARFLFLLTTMLTLTMASTVMADDKTNTKGVTGSNEWQQCVEEVKKEVERIKETGHDTQEEAAAKVAAELVPTPPTPVVQKVAEKTVTLTQNGKSLGKFRLTVYTPSCDGGKWGYQTATGVKSTHLTTCAVDPKVIPLGSTLGVGSLTLKAVDTGSAVKGKTVDIFYDGTISQATNWLSSFGESKDVILIK